MSNTPAAALARMKIQYPAWRIERQADLLIATERNGKRVIRATNIGEFESQLAKAGLALRERAGAP